MDKEQSQPDGWFGREPEFYQDWAQRVMRGRNACSSFSEVVTFQNNVASAKEQFMKEYDMRHRDAHE